VWLNPVATEDVPFMNCLRNRVQKCTEEKSLKCFAENMPYVVDLDNYGPPTMQRQLAKLLQFIQDMTSEAVSYETNHPLENELRTSFINNTIFFRLQLFSLYKKSPGVEFCGPLHALACGGTGGFVLPFFFDPYQPEQIKSHMYIFLHELGHVLKIKSAVSVQSKKEDCRPNGHGLDWHFACLFLSRMALRALKRNGIVDSSTKKLDMQFRSEYHDCFLISPTLLEPEGPWPSTY